MAHQSNYRYNHTWIHPTFYLRMQHPLSSRNMDLCHPPSPLLRQIYQSRIGKTEQQQTETFPMTGEPCKSPSTCEDYRSAHKMPHNISIVDEMKSYNKLRKSLDR
jgi:hypothetical protein